MKSLYTLTISLINLIVVCLPTIIQGQTELATTEISASCNNRGKLFKPEINLIKKNNFKWIYLEFSAKNIHSYNEMKWFKDDQYLISSSEYLLETNITLGRNGCISIISTIRAQGTNVLPRGRYYCEIEGFKSNFILLEYLNQPCHGEYDCGHNMVCNTRCECKGDEYVVYDFQCLAKVGYGEECKTSNQCKDEATHCDVSSQPPKCRCDLGYVPYKYWDSIYCHSNKPNVPITGSNLNKDVYKAAIVALSCFVVTVFGLISLFLCNRRFVARRHAVESHFTSRRRESDISSRRDSDIFNVSEGLVAMRVFDKPPSYQEVIVQEQTIRGVPPPDYNDAVSLREMARSNGIVVNQQSNTRLNTANDRANSSGGVTNAAFVSDTSFS